VRSCRTASVFAMGVVVAVMTAAACREALTPTIPPVTTASPHGAPLLGGEKTTAPMSSSDAGPSTSAVMTAAFAEPPAAAKLVDAPTKLDAAVCTRTLVAVVKGTIRALSETLGAGDVLVLANSAPFEITGMGTVVWAQMPIASCSVESPPASTKAVVSAAASPKLAWAGGTMTARLDVQSPELYLGRLAGTAPVAEHSHAGSWEILVAIDAKGTFIIDGTPGSLGPGQILMIPPGTTHAWKPDPGSKLVAVQMYSPPGPEQRFVALAAADKDAGATVKDAGIADAR
jgi:quercetin dioxygenase-like cupin family protein